MTAHVKMTTLQGWHVDTARAVLRLKAEGDEEITDAQVEAAYQVLNAAGREYDDDFRSGDIVLVRFGNGKARQAAIIEREPVLSTGTYLVRGFRAASKTWNKTTWSMKHTNISKADPKHKGVRAAKTSIGRDT